MNKQNATPNNAGWKLVDEQGNRISFLTGTQVDKLREAFSLLSDYYNIGWLIDDEQKVVVSSLLP